MQKTPEYCPVFYRIGNRLLTQEDRIREYTGSYSGYLQAVYNVIER